MYGHNEFFLTTLYGNKWMLIVTKNGRTKCDELIWFYLSIATCTHHDFNQIPRVRVHYSTCKKIKK